MAYNGYSWDVRWKNNSPSIKYWKNGVLDYQDYRWNWQLWLMKTYGTDHAFFGELLISCMIWGYPREPRSSKNIIVDISVNLIKKFSFIYQIHCENP